MNRFLAWMFAFACAGEAFFLFPSAQVLACGYEEYESCAKSEPAFIKESDARSDPLSLRRATDKPLAFEWSKWNIYRLNESFCREKNGDVVCLSPRQATNHRWNIPSSSVSP